MLNKITELVNGSKGIAANVAGLLMTVAFVVFMLAIINYIWKRRNGEAEALKQAGTILFGSVFALFVMVAVWGITNFIAINLGIGVGGCTGRPSPVPGQTAQDDCLKTTTTTPAPNTTGGAPVYTTGPVITTGSVNCNTLSNAQCTYSHCHIDSIEGCVDNSRSVITTQVDCTTLSNANCTNYSYCTSIFPSTDCVHK